MFSHDVTLVSCFRIVNNIFFNPIESVYKEGGVYRDRIY